MKPRETKRVPFVLCQLEVYAEYRQAREEMRQLLKAKVNVELLLGIDDKPMEQETCFLYSFF